MPDPKAQEIINDNAKQFIGMAELFEMFAANSYNEWAGMKYKKVKEGQPGHTSKKKFEEYRRYVYMQYRLSLHRAGLCKAAAQALKDGDDMDFERFEPDSPMKAAGKVVLGTFKNLIP